MVNIPILDMSQAEMIGWTVRIIPLLIGLMVFFYIMQFLYNHIKLKPEERRKGANLHADIVGILESIYLAYWKAGHRIEKKYPKKEDVIIKEGKVFGINSWLIRPNSYHHIKDGDVGKIYAQRLDIWRKEDRARIASLLAAWWFNLYYYASNNQSIEPLKYAINPAKLGPLRRICRDTLQFAGVEHAAELTSAGNIDIVHVLTDKQKVEHQHRKLAHIAHEDIARLGELREKEEFAYGKPQKVHKLARSRLDHAKNLVHLGKKELELLKKDLNIRRALGESKADADYRALEMDVLRLEVITTWLGTNTFAKMQDPQQQNLLQERLSEFDKLFMDVSARLEHLDQILEQGSRHSRSLAHGNIR